MKVLAVDKQLAGSISRHQRVNAARLAILHWDSNDDRQHAITIGNLEDGRRGIDLSAAALPSVHSNGRLALFRLLIIGRSKAILGSDLARPPPPIAIPIPIPIPIIFVFGGRTMARPTAAADCFRRQEVLLPAEEWPLRLLALGRARRRLGGLIGNIKPNNDSNNNTNGFPLALLDGGAREAAKIARRFEISTETNKLAPGQKLVLSPTHDDDGQMSPNTSRSQAAATKTDPGGRADAQAGQPERRQPPSQQ